ncbi:prepilin-type N-terminal cleavage/methylation domain-containing protein [Thiomicrorhabdus sp.]|uniref:prepilin-type N-terminal cleavage/methylation domain-containing protein n=1 Tax=Thiomicrorhabdus sp. TaxID=2039724 RepID=UPI0035613767
MKNTQAQLQNQKGFTLVEIAIVLVIIGLLLGGVLKGQELIENSKVKSVTADFDNIAAAYWAYRDRKGVYPGTTNAAFWYNLRTEGFLTGDPATSTTATGSEHALEGVFEYVPAAATNMIPNKAMICASNIEDTIATNIDTKLDDGVATTGTVRGGTADVSTAAAYTATGAAFILCKELK